MFDINFCQWLDSHHGPLDLEATALPTEPQPLPSGNGSYIQFTVNFLLTELHARNIRPSLAFVKQEKHIFPSNPDVMTSVTRLGNLLDFGQLFKAFGNN